MSCLSGGYIFHWFSNALGIVVIATNVMSYPNFIVTYELMIKLHEQICAQGYLNRSPPQKIVCFYQADVMLIPISPLLLPSMLCPNQISVFCINF